MTKSIKDLLRAAKKRRQNRAYYAKYCGITDLRTAGVLQDPEKTRLDLVQIEDGERNELIHLFGFNPKDSSHFRLKLSIVSLLDRWFVQGVQDASKWRLASVSLTLRLASGVQLSYEHEQLIDYDQKRQAADRHEHRNIYKVGSVSIETVLPFSLSRILFNGLMRVESDGGPTGSASSVSQFRPIRLTISTHPTCDKFDYAYRFGSSYSADVISRSMRASQEQDVERSLALLLEDRFDQPLMFQGDLETLDGSGGKDDNQELPQLDETFVMWGAKVKKYLDARRELTTSNSQKDEPRDCLFVWTECGHQIHLSRPERHPNLLYGMVHNSFDYASYLYEASLNMFEKTNGDEDVAVTVEKRIEFSELDQFKQLTSSHVIRLRAFKVREYKLEFLIDDASAGATSDSDSSRSSLMRVRLNGFDGWALRLRLDFGELIEETQNKLLLMALNDRLLSSKLAEEKLLGGKGSSLAGLSQSLEMGIRVDRLSLASSCEVSVPRGLVITSHAYGWWLRSDERIMKSIRELDAARRELATRSALQLNPMSSDSGTCLPSLGEIQRTLQALCQQTRAQLIECPLPESLRQQLCRDLVGIFGEEALGLGGPPPADNDSAEASQAPQLKKFAVRSSAVGEDSLETSAAGQMRTILNARGIDSICQAVVECWASQFELEAVTYKSQNGLQFNLPMAVVVQELVECQVAGVAATCDPMTGNRTRLEITANRGLGEGVVSGKQADTIRVTLTNLKWDARLEDYTNQSVSLKSEEADGDQLAVSKIEKLTTKDGECCLTDEQIVALANLLLEIRRTNELQDREVEWGITMIKPEENAEATMERPQTPDSSTTSSSSSSSSSSTDTGVTLVPFRRAEFKIHMFQSRPLTNLRRLSTREIDHELDYGAQSPLDLCSRANLGEVMPGALCPINQSWFMPMVSSYLQQRPDLKEYTRNYYSMAWFGFHTGLATSILTNCMSVKYYFNDNEHDRQLQQAVNYTMVGTMFDKPSNEIELDKFERFCRERQLPLMQPLTPGLGILLPVDLGIFQTLELAAKRDAAKTKLHDDLLGLNELIELVKGDCGQDDGRHSEQILCEQIRRLFERLTKRTSPLTKAWVCHLLASFTSVAFNMMSLKIIGDQPAYKGKSLVDNELLNDFSVLIRKSVKGGTNQLGDHHQSESGDISKLLERLLECFVETKQLELMKTMKPFELYKYLTDPANDQLKSSKLFGEFMARNGHRAWKEFCLGTKTWGDDPSYIMRLFAARLKAYSPEEADRERARKLAANSDHEAQLERVSAKLTNNRFVLMNYALPRARNATMRRESSKSLLIKTIHKYRQAFRHLAGLLCLAGLLPNAELIFFMTIQELDEIVVKCCSLDESARQPRETIMPRLLYKARRRQQRCRLFDKVTFPRPTVSVNEMMESIQEQTRQWDGPKMPVLPVAASGHHSDQPVESTLSSDRPEVRGITSCSGCVTGRACVISSLDDVDQLEPNDILVTYSIDISWSVYFFMLAGIVTEVGGIVSHGAVVAREYGLPTLCTAVGACTKFKTGQLITLNASRGVCHLATKDRCLDEGTV